LTNSKAPQSGDEVHPKAADPSGLCNQSDRAGVIVTRSIPAAQTRQAIIACWSISPWVPGKGATPWPNERHDVAVVFVLDGGRGWLDAILLVQFTNIVINMEDNDGNP
jgi:hypothetical protein